MGVTKNQKNMSQVSVLIGECEESESRDLLIENVECKMLPERIKDFWWINKLILRNVGLKCLSNFPCYLVYLEISNNSIQELDGSLFPSTLKKFAFINNDTIDVYGLKDGLEFLDLSKNKIRKNFEIPNSLIALSLFKNRYLCSIPKYQPECGLIAIEISDTGICDISMIPDSVEIIIANNCYITSISKLPHNLKNLTAQHSNIMSIDCPFPEGLEDLDLFDNMLTQIPPLPKTIRSIDVNNNMFEENRQNKSPVFQNEYTQEYDETEYYGHMQSHVNIPRFGQRPRFGRSYNHSPHFQQIVPIRPAKPNNPPYVEDNEFSDENPRYIKLKKTYTV